MTLKATWWPTLLLIAIITFILQTHLYLHKDVAYILHTASRMMEGQTYAHDIYEPNPPLIFYLQMPALWLSHILSINIVYVFRSYVIAILSISAAICYTFIKRLLISPLSLMFSYGILFILFLLPAHQFGQREHLMLALVLPYIFSTAFYLNNISQSFIQRVSIAIFAAIGFAIKPFFLPALVFIEGFCLIKKKNFFRIEPWLMGSCMIAYLMIIVCCHPEYLKNVLPLWAPYYEAIRQPWLTLLLSCQTLFCLAMLIFSAFTYSSSENKNLHVLLIFSLLGFLISFFIPRVTWYYHIYPALGIACLLALALIYEISTCLKNKIALSLIIGICVFYLPVTTSATYTYQAIKFYYSNNAWKKIAAVMHGNSTFDCYSMTHEYILLEFYFNMKYTGGFPFQGWEYNNKQAYAEKNISNIKTILGNILIHEKPHYIIFDTVTPVLYTGKNFNFLNQLKENKVFSAAMKHYKYFTTIEGYAIYY